MIDKYHWRSLGGLDSDKFEPVRNLMNLRFLISLIGSTKSTTLRRLKIPATPKTGDRPNDSGRLSELDRCEKSQSTICSKR